MKIKFYYLLLALIALLMSCGNAPRTEKDSVLEYEVIEIGSCEYILVTSQLRDWRTITSIAHKGNCKYCEERRNHVAGERW